MNVTQHNTLKKTIKTALKWIILCGIAELFIVPLAIQRGILFSLVANLILWGGLAAVIWFGEWLTSD